MKLTEKQQELIDYIFDYQSKNKKRPTLKEMGEHCNRSVSSIQQAIYQLERKGLEKRDIFIINKKNYE